MHFGGSTDTVCHTADSIFMKKGLSIFAGGLVTLGLAVSSPALAGALGSPFRVEAGGKPIDVDVGHAAPLVVDFDGDGIQDLLVGQFGSGKLRIYRNTGSNGKPVFGQYAWFKAGGTDGSIPSG